MAISDRREAILQRILHLLGSISGVEEVVRDRGDLESSKRPAIYLLDGSETAGAQIARGRGLGRLPPAVVTLSPQIFVILKDKGPKNEGVGEELSAFRIKVLKALREDGVLLNLLGENGGIVYRGSETDMQTGSTMSGQLQMMFDFQYPLNPADL